MKIPAGFNRSLLIILAALSLDALQPVDLHAQGSLTPTGAPAPTMKSLDQVEARTPITNASSLVTISQAGSYYLTHNLTVSSGDAIDITTNQVTLDLNGFAIATTAAGASGSAIYLTRPEGNVDVNIRNGNIRGGVTNNASGIFSGPGFVNGITVNPAGNPDNIRVSEVSVSGCLSNGINLGNNHSTIVNSCMVRRAGYVGIGAGIVMHCTAFACGQAGIYAFVVSESQGEEVQSDGWGIQCGTANNCGGTCNGTNADGIYAAVANNSNGTSYAKGGTGLLANTANNCIGVSYGAGGTGLAAASANNCFGTDSSQGTNGIGLSAGIAIGCYGSSGGSGITATIGNSCIVNGGTTNISRKYNMP